MRGSTTLFSIHKIPIKLHYSWWFIFAFLVWSLSTAFFPHYYPEGYSVVHYWTLGCLAALLLFVSVLFHELSHSFVARSERIKVESITLFFFGGVSGIDHEDMKPSSEFLLSVAGPLFSFLLAGIFYLLYIANSGFFLTPLSFYLFQLNLVLGIFNLIPGYPLDGGRAFRALLFAYFKDIRKATKIAVFVGRLFAITLIVFGIFGFIQGLGNGLWLILLGGFLYFIGGMSYEQVVLKEVLKNITVKDVMQKRVVKIKPSLTFSSFITQYARLGENLFVVKDARFAGLLDLTKIRKMASPMQEKLKVKDLSLPLHLVRTVRSTDSAYDAYVAMMTQGVDMIPVIDRKEIRGIITKNAVLTHFMWGMKFGYSGSRKMRRSSQKKKSNK